MLAAIRDESVPRENPAARTRFRNLVERLEESLPEVYQHERGFLLESLIEDAISDQDWDRMAVLLHELAEIADTELNALANSLSALRYHGQTQLISDIVTESLAVMANSPDILQIANDELRDILLDLDLFRYMETSPAPHADDPALTRSVPEGTSYNPEWLHVAVPHLSASEPSAWERTDFDEAVDAETWERNITALLFEFIAERHRVAGVPFSRSNLILDTLHTVLRQQMSQEAPRARSAKPRKGKRPLAPPHPSPLIPNRDLLDRALAGKFNLLGREPYPVAAVMELLPAYLHFLAQLGVIHPVEMDQALGDLHPLVAPILRVLTSSLDAAALRNVERAWSEDELNMLRQNPSLAEARSHPQVIPPPAPNPLATARTYRFKVTYLRVDDVWFLIELRREDTLQDLHRAIQRATDFDDDHLYSFYLSGRAWDTETEYAPREAGHSTRTRIGDVPLRLKQHFLYLFDYGDEHTFDVQLIEASDTVAATQTPRVIEQHGTMPPQYGDWDEDEEDDWDGEEDDWDKDEDGEAN